MYIAFEGIDGSGKTTQIKLLCEWLENQKIDFKFIPQPMESTKIGKTLRQYLKEGYTSKSSPYIFALLFAANRAEINDEMINEKHSFYLTDRCLYSNLVYSNLEIEWFNNIEKYSPIPDVVFLFDIDPEIAVSRVDGNEKYESLENLKKVRRRYLDLAELYKNRFFIIDVEHKSKCAIKNEVQQLFLYGGLHESKNE